MVSDMTKVEISERTAKDAVESTLKRMRERKEHWKNLAPPCPEDGQPGIYVEMLVTPPPVTAAVYRCPGGDMFSWREGVGAKLLSNQKDPSEQR